ASRSVRSSAARRVSPARRSSRHHLASSSVTVLDLARTPARWDPSTMRWSPIVELRQYTLHPGMRDVFIDLFEANFVESQEDAGMKIIGTFRDLDDPDGFVWLRGFDTMDSRARSLRRFYGGPVWQRHRDAANRAMVDSDNVLLLRPARSNGGFILEGEQPARSACDGGDCGLVEALVVELDKPPDIDMVDRLAQDIAAAVAGAGGAPLASFVP